MIAAIELPKESLECSKVEQLNLLQTIVEIVQTQVYLFEGAVGKIMAFEGGLIAQASWGNTFFHHADDAARSIFAANEIKEKLTRF